MSFNAPMIEQLERALGEHHPGGHVFSPHPNDPQMCGKCGWLTPDNTSRGTMAALLEDMKEGRVLIGTPFLITFVEIPILPRRSLLDWLLGR